MGSAPVSGGGEYARRVFSALVEAGRGTSGNEHGPAELLAVADAFKYLDPRIEEIARSAGIPIYNLQNLRRELIPLIVDLKVDTFFSALPLRFRSLQFPPTVRFIYTIHGLRPLELLGDRYEARFFYSLRSIFRFLIVRAIPRLYKHARRRDFLKLFRCAGQRRIVTASDHSRFALLTEFPFLNTEEIISLYSPAAEKRPSPDDSILSDLNIEPQQFILLICGNRWAKNPYRAVQALLSLQRKGLLNKRVVITGRGRVGYLKHMENDRTFVVTDYLKREQLEALYKNAALFLFPSLNEGFGYPPLECMHYGTPVIASPVTSLPELLGDAVLWADPLSIRELEGRILRVLSDHEVSERLREEGPRRREKILIRQHEDLHKLIDLIFTP